MTETLDQSDGESRIGQSIESAVQANGRRLEQLLCQVSQLTDLVASTQLSGQASPDSTHRCDGGAAGSPDGFEGHHACEAERIRLEDQVADLESRLAELDSQLADLRQQNRDLAAKVADKNVRKAISDAGPVEALSWEQRKQLIIEQMEEESFDAESFDAESFAANMPYQSDQERETPQLFVERLLQDLETRKHEVQELRLLLDQQTAVRDRQREMEAVLIAEKIDSDELVKRERDRLQRLQTQWEEKLREEEIEASLERAKLSRQRQELAKRQADLEEELEHIRREKGQKDGETPATSRRWLVKLGLGDQA